jgi:hypothetical protein
MSFKITAESDLWESRGTFTLIKFHETSHIDVGPLSGTLCFIANNIRKLGRNILKHIFV